MALDILIVVPAFNEEKFIVGCVSAIRDALQKKELKYKVVVIDNGSVDRTGTLAQGAGASLLTIERSSVSFARNAGAAQAESKFIAFIDADVLVTREWGDAISNLIANSDNPSILTGCQYSVRDDAGWIERHWFKNLEDKHLNGGNIIVSRRAFELSGGFDESLKTGEDYDFCLRTHKKGAEYLVDRQFKAIHLGFPRGIFGFLKREMWHGEGDFRSFSTFIRSPVAQIAIIYVVVILAVPALLVFGDMLYGVVLAILFISGNLLLTWYRFQRCSVTTVLSNSLINVIYFLGRAASFFRAVINSGKRY